MKRRTALIFAKAIVYAFAAVFFAALGRFGFLTESTQQFLSICFLVSCVFNAGRYIEATRRQK